MKRQPAKRPPADLRPRVRPEQLRVATALAKDLAPTLQLRALRGLSYADMKAALFIAFDLAVVEPALNRNDRNITAAAEELEMPRQSLQVIMKKRGMKGAPRRQRR